MIKTIFMKYYKEYLNHHIMNKFKYYIVIFAIKCEVEQQAVTLNSYNEAYELISLFVSFQFKWQI